MPRKRSGAGVERQRERQLRDLPDGIPFQCLGLDADHYYVIDGDGLFRPLPRDRAGHMLMLGVCGGLNQDWAFHHYARWRKKGADEFERIPRTLQPELLGQDIALLSAIKGPFSPADAVRMQGAWLGADGDLVLHCGDHLWIRGARCDTGMRERHAYPRMPPLGAPHSMPVDATVGREVLADLAAWRLGREIDPVLLLGMLGLGMLAGAMHTRPNILLLGEHGTGKSGLLQRCKDYLGMRMLLSADATPAGLTQRVGLSNLLIGLDEREPGENPGRDAQLLALLRTSYTGGESLRGGQDHTAHSFSLRCPVLAAAIRAPAMDSADRSRNVRIRVEGPPSSSDPASRVRLVYDARREAIGLQLLRRLADGWKRLQLEILPAWGEALQDLGYDGRGIDTLGTLLAIAWVLREDGALTRGAVDGIAADLEQMQQSDRAERQPSYQRFLDHVLGISVDPMRKGEWRTVLELVSQAAGYGVTAEARSRVPQEAARIAGSDEGAKDAQRQLSRIGMRVGADPETGDALLSIANQSTVLGEMLRGTIWAGVPGRSSPWATLLLRAPGAAPSTSGIRFSSGYSRAVNLKLEFVLRGMVGPDPESAAQGWDEAMREMRHA
jgi:hypothetical protein